MGGSGHAAAMHQRLKANRAALLSKRKNKRKAVIGTSKTKTLSFKKVDRSELSKINRRIREKLLLRKTAQRIAFIVVFSAALLGFYFLFIH